MRKATLLVFFLALAMASYGQSESFSFEGLALDVDTNEPIAFATVRVLNRNKGMATTNTGSFQFDALVGDEVKISSIGYHDYIFVITEEFKDLKEPFKAYLIPRTYVLDSVEVIQMRDNFYLKKPIWDTLEFQNPFLNTTNPRDWSKSNIVPNTDGSAGFAITGFLNSFDKDLQQKRYLDRFKKADKFRADRKAELEKKFNKEFVKEITNIDDRVIEEFMEFCDFRDGQILRATEYELTVMILARYKEFLVR